LIINCRLLIKNSAITGYIGTLCVTDTNSIQIHVALSRIDEFCTGGARWSSISLISPTHR